jgi:choline dehydrogenase-like flavoprotein
MSVPHEYDVCIVGSGFAGTFLGLRLVERGIDTAIVEAGSELPPNEPLDGRVALFPHEKSGDAPFPVDFNRSISIGGTSRKWNGVVARFMPTDFRPKTSFGLFEDWPITCDDLTPYYDDAERALETEPGSHVRGSGVDRLPPLPGPDELGLFPIGFSIRNPHGSAIRLNHSELPRFAGSPHGTLLAERKAIRIQAGHNGAVTGVEVSRPDGSLEMIRARRIVLAAGVVENARLLLASTSSRFPNGIGNETDLVGRYINAHPRPRVHVPRLKQFHDTRGVFRSVRYCDEFRRNGLAAACVDLNFLEDEPAVDITLETEPAAENRVRLDPSRRDALGRPLAVVMCHATERDRRTRAAALELQQKLAGEILAPGRHSREAEFKCFHPAGGCRMGLDENSAVVDREGRVFGTDNLYVAGASVFPSSGALNPTLTVVALALRLGDHLTAAS